MSFLKTIQLFVANNPGLTNKEIAAALPEYALHSVQRAVCRLVMLNRAERKGVRPNFRYYAKAPVGPIGPIVPRYPVEKAEVMPEPKQESAPNPAVIAMMDKAISAVIVIALMFYQRGGARHRPLISLMAYFTVLVYASVPFRYLFGLYHESHWFVVLVNVLICAAVLWARGNVARLVDVLRH